MSQVNALGRFVASVRTFQRYAHYAAGAMLLALLALTDGNILSRNLFDRPITGTVEVTPLLLVVAIFLGFGYVEHQGGHISVDLVYSRLGPIGQRISRVISRVITLAVIGVLTWRLWVYAGQQDDAGAVTASLEWPLHIFIRISAVGAAMFLLAALVEIVAEIVGIDDSADTADDHGVVS